MEKILIVTCKNDTHPNSVIELLNKKGIPFLDLIQNLYLQIIVLHGVVLKMVMYNSL